MWQQLRGQTRPIRDALALLWQRSAGSVSLTVIWICVGVFLAIDLLDVLGVVHRSSMIGFLGLSSGGVFRRLWLHQFVTAPFVHGSVVHLLFNMLSLWFCGPDVERLMGRRHYVWFSVSCALVSMLGALLLSLFSGNITIGYSGVIFGLFVAQALFFPERLVIMFFFFPMRMKYGAIIFCAVELYLLMTDRSGNISHSAHLAGAVVGWAYIRIVFKTGDLDFFRRYLAPRRVPRMRWP